MDSIELNKLYKEEKKKAKSIAKGILDREKRKVSLSNKIAKSNNKSSNASNVKTVKKKSTLSAKKKRKADLLKRAKIVVYARDRDVCQWCGKYCSGFNRHASHIIPVSANGRLALYPINMKVLCYHCHMNVWHKNPLQANKRFQEKFPWRMEELEYLIKGMKTWTITEYELDIIEKIIEEEEKKYLLYNK